MIKQRYSGTPGSSVAATNTFNAGENLFGLGLEWFSPRFLPLNTYNTNFKASNIKSSRTGNTLHPYSQVSKPISNKAGRKKPGIFSNAQLLRPQDALSSSPTTGQQTSAHASFTAQIAQSSLTHQNDYYSWDKSRPVPVSLTPIDPGHFTQSGRGFGEGNSQTVESRQSGDIAVQNNKRPLDQLSLSPSDPAYSKSTDYIPPSAGQLRDWTLSPFPGFAPTGSSFAPQPHQQFVNQPFQVDSSFDNGGKHQDIEFCGTHNFGLNHRRIKSRDGTQLQQQRHSHHYPIPAVQHLDITIESKANTSPNSRDTINRPLPVSTPAHPSYSATTNLAFTSPYSQLSDKLLPTNTTYDDKGFVFAQAPDPAQDYLQQSPASSSFPACSASNSSYCQFDDFVNHQNLSSCCLASSRPNSPHSLQFSASMAGSFSDSNDELAQMQQLSNSWEPEAIGPLVSELLPSSNLTKEYANADPVYQVKTASLPGKYAQYRTCRGDGQCGWRAVAFSYYEKLIHLGDKQKIVDEEQRLKSLAILIEQTGIPEHIYEDWLEEAISLLREIANMNDESGLVIVFNDAVRSMDIITFFKTLTSAWLRSNIDTYQPYVEEASIDEYCKRRVDPANSEIDHVALTALMDLLIKPAGIGAEVLYLDRSFGEEVMVYTYEPNQDGPGIANHPCLRLLYRPGHYDILYKLEDLPAPSSIPSEVIVGFTRHHASHMDTPAALPFVGTNHEVPGMELFPGQHNIRSWAALETTFDFQAAPISDNVPPSHLHGMTRTMPIRTHYRPHARTSSISTPDYFNRSTPSSHVITPTSPISPMTYGAPAVEASPFRPSRFELEADFMAMNTSSPVYQTSIFKNSHFNLAHFNNPSFTPEQWHPDMEYPSEKRKRSS